MRLRPPSATDSVVDWDRIERHVDPAARVLVGHLRLVERIASVHAWQPVAAFERSLRDSVRQASAPLPAAESLKTWGPLTIVEPIGRGSYADVYLAHDPRLDRPVALKLLRHRDGRGTAVESEVIDEARLLARVRHQNVITVYGAERIDGRAGIWMELVDGRTLEQELRARGPLPAGEIVAIGVALCGAVAAVHAVGLLHRDIKTQNVMIGRDGRILLTDFGTSREVVDTARGGELAGTPLYLAPEVLGAGPATASSDVYSLGVVLYHLATGTYPICGRSLADLRDAVGSGVRVPVLQRRRDLPRAVASVIERAADPVPERRYESATATGAALAAALRRRSRVLWAALTTLLVIAASAMAARWPSPGVATPPRFIVVGAFENETGDRRLDDTVQFALGQELMQSRVLTVVPAVRIEDAFRLMKRPPATVLDARTAREVGLRDGNIQMFATGRVDRLGTTFAVRVMIHDVATGELVTQAGVEVDGVDDILAAVRTLASSIRTAVGDNKRQVDSDLRLERVTTASLEALRDYTAGVALLDDSQWEAAELRLSAAVRQDASFASAVMMLAHSRRNQQRPESDYMPMAQQAFALAAGLPTRERFFIEGSYYGMRGDTARAIAAYDVLTREHPEDFWGLNNLAAQLLQSGRYREEIPILKRLAALRPNNANWLVNYAMRLIADGDGLTDARRLIERASTLELPPGDVGTALDSLFETFPAYVAWVEGRVEDAAAVMDCPTPSLAVTDHHLRNRGHLNLTLGRGTGSRAHVAVDLGARRACQPVGAGGLGAWRHGWGPRGADKSGSRGDRRVRGGGNRPGSDVLLDDAARWPRRRLPAPQQPAPSAQRPVTVDRRPAGRSRWRRRDRAADSGGRGEAGAARPVADLHRPRHRGRNPRTARRPDGGGGSAWSIGWSAEHAVSERAELAPDAGAPIEHRASTRPHRTRRGPRA